MSNHDNNRHVPWEGHPIEAMEDRDARRFQLVSLSNDPRFDPGFAHVCGIRRVNGVCIAWYTWRLAGQDREQAGPRQRFESEAALRIEWPKDRFEMKWADDQ